MNNQEKYRAIERYLPSDTVKDYQTVSYFLEDYIKVLLELIKDEDPITRHKVMYFGEILLTDYHTKDEVIPGISNEDLFHELVFNNGDTNDTLIIPFFQCAIKCSKKQAQIHTLPDFRVSTLKKWMEVSWKDFWLERKSAVESAKERGLTPSEVSEEFFKWLRLYNDGIEYVYKGFKSYYCYCLKDVYPVDNVYKINLEEHLMLINKVNAIKNDIIAKFGTIVEKEYKGDSFFEVVYSNLNSPVANSEKVATTVNKELKVTERSKNISNSHPPTNVIPNISAAAWVEAFIECFPEVKGNTALTKAKWIAGYFKDANEKMKENLISNLQSAFNKRDSYKFDQKIHEIEEAKKYFKGIQYK